MIVRAALPEIVSMLDLLINVEFNLLYLFWGISLVFLGVAILMCCAIVIRRIFRNQIAAKRKRQKIVFRDYVSAGINADPESPLSNEVPICQISDMTDVFLHYFRTLKGEKLERLRDMISGSQIEPQIIANSYKGVRGVRMRAIRTLSYLESQTSLQVIFENLSSQDKYIRLTAMRCLTRRKADMFVNEIIWSYIEAFPRDPKLLASILANFGKDIVGPLQNQVQTSNISQVRTACLEALALLRPERLFLDFSTLMRDESESVRAAALSLAAVSNDPANTDPLRLGLKDKDTAVKIRAAKMACHVKRSDLMQELYKLSSDSNMWVRYWSLRAIWLTGRSGKKFVDSLAPSHPMATNVALEMRSGYV